mgnify:FL=1
MIIYLAIIIPIIAIIFLYIVRKQEIVWWEPLLLIGSCAVFIFISKLLVDYSSIKTKEYWGSFVTRIEYYEPWNEYIYQTCTSTCCCDSKGENCMTTTYDCSYVQYHSAHWEMVDNIGQSLSISESEYNYIKNKFGGEFFIELNRDYHTQDGDEYACEWKGDSISSQPITTIHYYDNKIKASDYTVFNFKKVDTTDIKNYSLKDYPQVGFANSMHAVIGDKSNDAMLADLKLQYYNAVVGPKREARIFFVIIKDKPSIAGDYQQAYWIGANMNEFIVTIGMDSKTNEIKWCKPFSWTTNEKLKVDIRDHVMSNSKAKLSDLADYVGRKVEQDFVRRDFKEFNYLNVEPSTTAIVIVFILTIIITIFLSFWIVNNDERNEDYNGRSSIYEYSTKKLRKLY